MYTCIARVVTVGRTSSLSGDKNNNNDNNETSGGGSNERSRRTIIFRRRRPVYCVTLYKFRDRRPNTVFSFRFPKFHHCRYYVIWISSVSSSVGHFCSAFAFLDTTVTRKSAKRLSFSTRLCYDRVFIKSGSSCGPGPKRSKASKTISRKKQNKRRNNCVLTSSNGDFCNGKNSLLKK